MSRKSRRTFTHEFKVEVALEALNGQKKLVHIAEENDLALAQVSQWKKKARDAVSQAFLDKRGRKRDPEVVIAELQEKVQDLEARLRVAKRDAQDAQENATQQTFDEIKVEKPAPSKPEETPSGSSLEQRVVLLERALDVYEATARSLRRDLDALRGAHREDHTTLESVEKRIEHLEDRTLAPAPIVKKRTPVDVEPAVAPESAPETKAPVKKRSKGKANAGPSTPKERVVALDSKTPVCISCGRGFPTESRNNSIIQCPHCATEMKWSRNKQQKWFTRPLMRR